MGPRNSPWRPLDSSGERFRTVCGCCPFLGFLRKQSSSSLVIPSAEALSSFCCSPTASFCRILFLAFSRISSASSCSCCERAASQFLPLVEIVIVQQSHFRADSVSWILRICKLHFDTPWRSSHICQVLSGRLCACLLWYLWKSICLPPLCQCNRGECWLASQDCCLPARKLLGTVQNPFSTLASRRGFRNWIVLEVPVAVGPSFAPTCLLLPPCSIIKDSQIKHKVKQVLFRRVCRLSCCYHQQTYCVRPTLYALLVR